MKWEYQAGINSPKFLQGVILYSKAQYAAFEKF